MAEKVFEWAESRAPPPRGHALPFAFAPGLRLGGARWGGGAWENKG
jgi:hypothetical protein